MFRKSLSLFIVAGLLATLNLLASALLTSQAQVTDNQFTDGTLVITTNPTSALITYANMAPGDAVTAPLQVTNAGSLALRYAMTTSGAAPDQILLGGYFLTVNGQSVPRLARITADGQFDAGFIPATDNNRTVEAIALQPDRKILVAGGGSAAFPLRHVIRLNSDGSADTGFNPPETNEIIYALALQPDGKIIIGGRFTTVNGQSRNRVARLNADGSVDATFNPSLDNGVSALALQRDGKILVAGAFGAVNSEVHNNLARLNADGSVDANFQASTNGPFGYILVPQPDGKVMIGGYFSAVNGQPRSGLARLHSDGTLDAGFNPLLDDSPETLVIQPDGKYVIGGYFRNVNGQARNQIARLNGDGSLDASFPGAIGPNAGGGQASVQALALQPDGEILVAGSFVSVSGEPHQRLARLNSDGSVDASFTASADGNSRAIVFASGLGSQLQLTIKSNVTTCATNGFAADGSTLYAGPLAAAEIGDATQGFQIGDRTLNAAMSETLCFQAVLPLVSANAYQNSTTTTTFTFDAEQTANNP